MTLPTLVTEYPWTWPWLAGLLGLLIGSFANVCIHRLPQGLSVVAPRSHCPHCRQTLSALDNFPVLSFLALGARCRYCRQRISWRYPAVELANAALWFGVAWLSPPTARALATLPFLTALLVLSLIDLEHFVLPDAITLPGTGLAVAASLLPGWPLSPFEALGSAGAGYLAFRAVAWSYRQTRGIEGLGQGDWKMAALLGAFLGWKALLLTVLMASVVGTLVGIVVLLRGSSQGLQGRLPFGVFLGLAGAVVVFCGERLLGWYGSLYPV